MSLTLIHTRSGSYTESKNQLLSATVLLKRAGSGMNARDFHIEKMKEKGFIIELERPSRKGTKKFKSLTGAGRDYGENRVSPGNPKEYSRFKEHSRFTIRIGFRDCWLG